MAAAGNQPVGAAEAETADVAVQVVQGHCCIERYLAISTARSVVSRRTRGSKDPPKHLIHRPGLGARPLVPEDFSSRSPAAAQCNFALEAHASIRIDDARGTIRHLATQLRCTETQQDAILDHYLGAGQRTAGGILHAVTSAAQLQDDADVAYDMERVALRAMTLAAAHQH